MYHGEGSVEKLAAEDAPTRLRSVEVTEEVLARARAIHDGWNAPAAADASAAAEAWATAGEEGADAAGADAQQHQAERGRGLMGEALAGL